MKYGVHWFRRDLRVAGNPGLSALYKKYDKKILGLFCFDKKFLARKDFSVNRFQFFLSTLIELKKELQALGSDLLVLDTGPLEAFEMLFKDLKKNDLPLPETISWCRDYEPFALKRDRKMKIFLEKKEIQQLDFRDHLIIEPHELLKSAPKKKGGEKSHDYDLASSDLAYQVFTPFSKKWRQLFQGKEFFERVDSQSKGLAYLKKVKKGESSKIFSLTWNKLFKKKLNYPNYLDIYFRKNQKKVTIKIPQAGSQAGLDELVKFKKKMTKYKTMRDFPSINATSGLSIYFKNGGLTTGQAIKFLSLKGNEKEGLSEHAFLNELIWREFYYHILAHFPSVENESFQKKFKKIKWENNKKFFKAWCEGVTGYPIVDAGMRQLKKTGWMHNRVRMIVASFLTKDLLIDWRWGENYFMKTLLDGDLAPNNGGWQWAASTGHDACPYFRIFNPWLQGKKFDRDGKYILEYLPELREGNVQNLHAPILDHKSYPAPIVDHAVQRKKALKLYS